MEHVNSPLNLSREATHINEEFTQQCLRPELQRLPYPHPFAQPGEETASVAYRYRRWQISENLTLVARWVIFVSLCLYVYLCCLFHCLLLHPSLLLLLLPSSPNDARS